MAILKDSIFTRTMEIEWARPREYSRQWRSMLPPDNFCLSVPLPDRKKVREQINSRRKNSQTVRASETETGSNGNSSLSSLDVSTV